jgi:hypothetical protein
MHAVPLRPDVLRQEQHLRLRLNIALACGLERRVSERSGAGPAERCAARRPICASRCDRRDSTSQESCVKSGTTWSVMIRPAAGGSAGVFQRTENICHPGSHGRRSGHGLTQGGGATARYLGRDDGADEALGTSSHLASGRSSISEASSLRVTAAYAAALRTSSSSKAIRPCVAASRRISTTRSRSVSDARVRSMPPR